MKHLRWLLSGGAVWTVALLGASRASEPAQCQLELVRLDAQKVVKENEAIYRFVSSQNFYIQIVE